MSYDLDAFPLPPGRSAQEFVESGDGEEHTADESPPTEAERAAMQRAAEALLALDPTAGRTDGDGWIEINAADMQVTVFPREAAVTIPYWGGDADAVMARGFEYARVLSETLGYVVWDPQTDTVVDFDAPERGSAASIFSDISARLDEMVPEPRRPWWKIWG